jgi:hypothetical protein
MKITLKILFIICLLQNCYSLLGQSTISGSVKDNSNKALPFVNVLLLKEKDSTLVKGAVSKENGAFTIENVTPGSYLICGTMVGYAKTYSKRVIPNQEKERIEIPAIVLQPETTQLKEVQVTGKKPLLEQKIDRTIVNVSSSIISSGSTALEILEKAPGVTVDRQNDQIQLRGKDGVIVQMDGKQTYLAMADIVALLRSMSSDNIDVIEIITNPSAKYDAAGNSGIINIRTKKNNNVGTNGSVSLSAGSGMYDRERGGVQLNHRTQRFNMFGSLNANRGGNFFKLDIKQTRDEEEKDFFMRTKTFLPMRDLGKNAKLGTDIFLSKNTTVGVMWTGTWNKHTEDGSANSAMKTLEDNNVFLEAHTDKTIVNKASNHLGNVNVTHKFSKNNAEISADFDVGFFRRNFENDLHTQINENDADRIEDLKNEMPTIIDIVTGKADYSQSIFKTWRLESGIKSSYVDTDNDMKLSRGAPGEVIFDPASSNHFKYTERVNAGYFILSGDINSKTKVLAGLRAEHTQSVGNSINLNNVVKRKYLNLFPSAFISRKITEKHSLNLSYSYRIDRPNYQSLNPARSYVDPYAFSQGNAYLRPQYTHSLELKHAFKEKYFTSIGASFINDYVLYVIRPVDSTHSERTPLNIGKTNSYNLTVSVPFTIMKGWSGQTTISGYYKYFNYTFKGIPQTSRQFSSNINVSNSFLFGKGWSGELTGMVFTPSVDAQVHVDWWGALNLGIQKKITNQLKGNFNVQDLLWTQRYHVHTIAPRFDGVADVSFDTRVFMFTLNYSIGNQNLKGARQRKTASEEENSRTSDR